MGEIEQNDLQAAIDAARATAAPVQDAPVQIDADTTNRGKAQTIPYDRFQEVVADKNNALRTIEKLQATLDNATKEHGLALQMLQQKEGDAKLVAEIRRLAENPKYRPFVEKLDKAIKGLDTDEDATAPRTGEAPKEDLTVRVQQEIAKAKAELQDQIADTQADALLSRADAIAREYMSSLPPEYTEDDKRVISRLVIDQIDWDRIEADPTNITQYVAKGFQQAINLNGTPRGIVAQNSNQAGYYQPADEVDHLNTLLQADWGKTKAVDRGGKTIMEPIVGEADFTKALAAAMRESNRR